MNCIISHFTLANLTTFLNFQSKYDLFISIITNDYISINTIFFYGANTTAFHSMPLWKNKVPVSLTYKSPKPPIGALP